MNRLVPILILMLHSGSAAASEPRFRVDALQLARPAAVSADGRFEVRASARIESPQGPQGRFALRSNFAGCTNTPADNIFANGFE